VPSIIINSQVVASATKKKLTTSTTPYHQMHQRNCSMQPTIMIPDDNMSGIIAGIHHPPKMCVDYLSHEWTKEDDIWTSWKVMSKQKKAFANGVRLENASWRTWAKQKYNLKTVNPEKLNWLKDSDVTWLYGPLHTAWSNHIEMSPKSPTTEDKLNLMPSSTKSCLKKRRTITEILRPTFSGRFGGSLITSNSDSQIYKKQRENDADSDCETASTCSSISGPMTPTTGPTKLPIEKENASNPNRKIQFNDCVEQCIAVESDEDVDELHDSDQESSSDDGIVMSISSKKDRKRDLSTICKLAPTKLKEDRIHNNEYSSLYSNHGRRRATSSNSSSSSPSSKSTTPSSSSTTTTTTTTHQPWMDDDDDDMDLDFLDFDQSSNISQSTPSHPSHYHAGGIIPRSGAPNENHHLLQDDDDYIEKAVNIANGVREIVHWVFRGRIF